MLMSMAGTVSRSAKTAEKTALGGLPAPVDDPPLVGMGVGAPCRGCGEAITPTEPLYTVMLLGAVALGFHAECYESWRTFKRGETRNHP